MSSHVIFGAGLIGSYIGACMHQLGVNVALVCRPTIKHKLISGVTLTDYQEHHANVTGLNFLDTDVLARLEPDQLKCDFLWLTVKCQSVAQAIQDIAPLVSDKTVILCCQNGLGSEKPVQNAFPNNVVLRVMVPFNVVELKAGHLHRGSQGHLTIEQTIKGQVSEILQERLNSPLLPVAQTHDMQALLWAKLQLNLGNSINALADIPVKSMLQQRGYRVVIATLMQELLTVTDELGIELPKVTSVPAKIVPYVLKLPNFLFTLVANKMLAVDPTVRTSMWWDMSQGKPTEIHYLNGAVVSSAERLGKKAPANKRIVTLIESLTSSNGAKKDLLNLARPISAKQLQNFIRKR
ncbi:2-dehydropantoate 2-reductase [Paraglaciecola sp. L1A13]|uniref:2-dehydropantoate 2-reductase n=1 Tax=Paraglaciecola sp. L1A13 TaxID=2686359 RepID=UPI00131EA484|nr:2-dehydropantoate 2-reductase [Paraglaciecola sp. L1A13]